jgi:hypothetical protein
MDTREDLTQALPDDHSRWRETDSSAASNERDSTSMEAQCCLSMLSKWCSDACRRAKQDNDKNRQSIMVDTLVESSDAKELTRNLLPLKRPYRTFKITDKTSVSLACSSKHILVKRAPHLCLLDKQLMIVEVIPWTYDHVQMCWSSTLTRFILITEEVLFTLDESNMALAQCRIARNEQIRRACGACSSTSLFLSTEETSTSLHQYALQPTIHFVREWQLASFDSKHEGILSFICGNEKLALVISNIHTCTRRLELRACDTLECLWFIRLDAVAHCCSIHGNQWMVMELLRPRLVHISADGKVLQDYRIKPSETNIVWNAVQLDDATLATFTMTSVNLHRLF